MKNRLQTHLFLMVTTIYWFSLYTYVPNLTNYAAELGAATTLIGMIAGSYGFTQMLIRTPYGVLSDRYNNRKMILYLGMFLSFLSSLIVWLNPTPVTLLIGRSIAGFSAGAWVAFTVMFASYFPKDKTTHAIGLLNAFNYIGNILGTLIGGIIAYSFGNRQSFLLGSCLALLGLLLTLAIREDKVERATSTPIRATDLLKFLRSKNLLILSTLAIFVQWITFGTIFGFTPIVAKDLGANPFEIGLLASFFTLPGILAAAMSGPFFVAKFGIQSTLKQSFWFFIIPTILTPFVPHKIGLYLLILLEGFGRGLGFPVLMSQAIEQVDEHQRATVMGIFQSLYGLGMFLGPFLFGVLSNLIGFKMSFISLGAIGFIALFLIPKLSPPRLSADKFKGYIQKK